MKRRARGIGDVFEIVLRDGTRRFMQHVQNDPLQLHTDVVRVFVRSFGPNETVPIDALLSERVDFYAHCILSLGAKRGFWVKVGNVSAVGPTDVVFRDTNDVNAIERTKRSSNWYVWKLGDEEFTSLGRLTGSYRSAHLGLIFSPQSILRRIQTGQFDITYPE